MGRFLILVWAFSFPPLMMHAQFKCIKGDCHGGYGECIFNNGDRYAGDFQRSKPHGLGILYFKDGNKYIGNWVEGEREGKGRLIFTTGDVYLGQIHQNLFHGKGIMTYVDSSRYDGDWFNNYPEGYGKFYGSNGSRYDGFFKKGLFDSVGVMFFSDGSRYEGMWKTGKRNGDGSLYLPDGSSLVGQWADDQYKGDWQATGFSGDTTLAEDCNKKLCDAEAGRFVYPDGKRYFGWFVKGVPQGNSSVYYPNGDKYEGGWNDSSPNGKGSMYYNNGEGISAIWKNGAPEHTLQEFQTPDAGLTTKASDAAEVKIWAVIVGVATYNYMPPLRYTDDDAYQIFAFLKSPEGGALVDDQIAILVDENASRSNILATARRVFSKADDNDVVLFYFSGHGLEGAFLPNDFDGDKNRLNHDDLKSVLRNSRAKHKLVLADACHSGSWSTMKSPLHIILQKYYKAFEESKGGTALMMSSRGEEYSLEDGGLRSGIFSHYLIKGLKGEADYNRNKIVTVQELYSYVLQSVKKYTFNVQTPSLSGDYDPSMPVGVIR